MLGFTKFFRNYVFLKSLSKYFVPSFDVLLREIEKKYLLNFFSPFFLENMRTYFISKCERVRKSVRLRNAWCDRAPVRMQEFVASCLV